MNLALQNKRKALTNRSCGTLRANARFAPQQKRYGLEQ